MHSPPDLDEDTKTRLLLLDIIILKYDTFGGYAIMQASTGDFHPEVLPDVDTLGGTLAAIEDWKVRSADRRAPF